LKTLLSVLMLLFTWDSAGAFQLSNNKWATSETVFYVDIVTLAGESHAPSGSSWNEGFQNAMGKWNAKTQFRFLSQESFADPCLDDEKNSVAFSLDACGTAFGSSTLAVTQGRFKIPEHTFIETDIIFSGSHNWDIYSGPNQFDPIDFSRTALHELGHALGLDHEEQILSIMRPKTDDLDSLQQDDIDGVTAIYGFLSPRFTLASGILHIPVVDVPGAGIFDVVMEQVEPTRFEFVLRSANIRAISERAPIQYSHETATLDVPSIEVLLESGEVLFFRIELGLIPNTHPLRFSLNKALQVN